MLPRVLDPCKRHSSKERAKLHRCAAMLTDNLGVRGHMGDIRLSTGAAPGNNRGNGRLPKREPGGTI